MALPIIIPDGGKRLVSLPTRRGEIIDVYDVRDLPVAFSEALGPLPGPPPATCGYYEHTGDQVIPFDAGMGVVANVVIPTYSYNPGPDAMNATLAAEYASRIQAWNAWGQLLRAIVLAVLPAAGKAPADE